MSSNSTFVIVGASLTGAKAAEHLRTEGFDGRIVLIGAETELPYERPPLSKDFLRGESEASSALVHDQAFYDDNNIELRLGIRVETINTTTRTVAATGMDPIEYDKLLIATGARSRKLNLPGADLPGVHYLRSLDDSRKLHDALGTAKRLAVVGAGWIGSEVAASARQMGVEVTLIDMASTPIQAVVGPEVGAVFADLHREHGVDLRFNETIESFLGTDRVTGVRTGSGDIHADLVVVGVGATPRVELAEAAGLTVDNGIVTDEFLQTAIDGVYAAGDVVSAKNLGIGKHLRVEHWANAGVHGELAAKNMLGKPTAYENVPFFFSDQYDLGLEYCGYPTPWDRVVYRGDPATREFIAFWLAKDRVVAAMNVNVWDVNDALQAIISADKAADDARLADPDVPLDEVLAR